MDTIFPQNFEGIALLSSNFQEKNFKVGRNHSVDEEVSPEKSTKLSKVILVVSNGAGPDSPSELRALLNGQQGERGEGCGSMTFDRPADLLWGFMVTMEK